MVNAQEWLDKKYPKEKRREVEEIYLNESSLEGELDLGDFTYWNGYWNQGVKILISFALDETKLTIKNKPEKAEVIKLIDVQKYLQQKYPTKEKREKVMELDIREKNLEGHLNLSDFTNLKKLICFGNKLTSFNLSSCSWLEDVRCSGNQLTTLDVSNCSDLIELKCNFNLLTELILPKNLDNLKKLWLNGNILYQNLSFLKRAINLESLVLFNNKFYGSLEYLKEMKKLKWLDITDTDIDSGLEYLPENVDRFYCSVEYRKDAKCQTICNLFVNEQGEIEIKKNFPQKLQAYKQKLQIKPQIEEELISNITSEQLTQQLINDKHITNPEHTWQDYLDYAQSPEELKARKDKIFASIENLKAEKQSQEELRKAEEKRILTSLISIERLYTIRRGMDRFLDRWRKGLPNLQWVERFEYAISTIQWANRGVLIASGVQLIRGDSSMSDWTTLISPFVEVFISNLVERYESSKLKQSLFAEDAENVWDSYNDLKAMLDPIEISLLSKGKVKTTLKKLSEKIHGFWKQHDINKDGEIDDEEWKVAKENFSQDLRNNWAVRKAELVEIKEIAEKLRKEISSYRKNEARNLGGKQKENINKIIPSQPEEVVIDLEETTNQSLNSSQINLLNKNQKEAIEMQNFEAQVVQKEPLGVPGSSKN